jgi:hypothetical protein
VLKVNRKTKGQIKMVENPSQFNADILQNLKRETSRTFRNKKEYLKGQINKLETNNNNKNNNNK